VINLNGKPTVVVARSAQRIHDSGTPTGERPITWKHLGA